MSSRHIAFDATPADLVPGSGVSQYATNLLAALIARQDGRRYTVLTNPAATVRAGTGMLRKASAIVPFRSLWMQFALPGILARLRPDLCHFTNFLAPVRGRCPFVVTFHDMGVFLHPRFHAWRNLAAARAIVPLVARRARRIITVSQSARADIISVLGVPASQIDVVYEAASPAFRPIEDQVELERVRRKYRLSTPFVLHVGTIEPRKNLCRLIEAIGLMRHRGCRETLVMAGAVGWKCADVLRLVEHSPPGMVRMLGYVPQEDLPALYNLARVVVFPSLYEGFGLPIVEAMACGVPVVTSNRSSMQEIAGGAALLVDPENPESLAHALEEVLNDEHVHAMLIAAGRRRADEFSWTRAAEETVSVYERATGTA